MTPFWNLPWSAGNTLALGVYKWDTQTISGMAKPYLYNYMYKTQGPQRKRFYDDTNRLVVQCEDDEYRAKGFMATTPYADVKVSLYPTSQNRVAPTLMPKPVPQIMYRPVLLAPKFFGVSPWLWRPKRNGKDFAIKNASVFILINLLYFSILCCFWNKCICHENQSMNFVGSHLGKMQLWLVEHFFPHLKVFNWSELHLSEVTWYKIHILV